MKKILLLLCCISILNCKKEQQKNNTLIAEELPKNIVAKITPINHATTVVEFDKEIMYIDPTGGKEAFINFNAPSYVLITDIHGDHMNIKTLEELNLSSSKVIAPKAVADRIQNIKCKELIVMNNSNRKIFSNFMVEAIPMYNLRKEALRFHKKGRGNGYVLTIGKERIYFSGDTEDIPEMRALKNSDIAFVCMNLPYTMTVESAASAVLDFKPKQVYPYHYRGTKGLSDIGKFKDIVNDANPEIKVIQLDWYPNRDSK